MAALVDLLTSTYAPVQAMILPYLDVADVIALTRASKRFAELQSILQSTAYNVNHFLKRFFSDPVAFRSVQGACGALLSGPVVRRFLHRAVRDEDCLLVFVTSDHRQPLIEYLENDFYELSSATKKKYLMTFTKTTTAGQILKVQIFNRSSPAVAQIFCHCAVTGDLNLLSWNKAYALFPCSTFLKSESYLLKALADVPHRCLSRLVKDGLKVKSVAWTHREVEDADGIIQQHHSIQDSQDDEQEDIPELMRKRRIGDQYTWTMELDTHGTHISDDLSNVLESTTFQLRIHTTDIGGEVAHYMIGVDLRLRHPVLKHQYVTLGLRTFDDDDDDVYENIREESYSDQKHRELNRRLNELTLIELAKITPSQRPVQYEDLMHDISQAASMRGHFSLPPTWTFYDDEVIAYLDQIWKIQQKIDEQERATRQALLSIGTHRKNDAMQQLLQNLLEVVKA